MRIPALFWLFILFLGTGSLPGYAATTPLKILTWEGYVTDQDVTVLDKQLAYEGYPFHVEIVKPYASGAEQMYSLLRAGDVDITFLTLFFIKMSHQRIQKYLQPIDTTSPRFTHLDSLVPQLTDIAMGKEGNDLFYLPFGGGVYGFFSNDPAVGASGDVNMLWRDELQGKFSLNTSQPWYNVGLALMALGKPPFYLNDLILKGKRREAKIFATTKVLPKLTALYRSSGATWSISPSFNDGLSVVSSWGPEIFRQNAQGGSWRKIDFTQGDMVWLDTLNLAAHLEGQKLAAAELVLNYFISPQVQKRVASELSLYPAHPGALPYANIAIDTGSFRSDMFVPPYNFIADNLINTITDEARKQARSDAHSSQRFGIKGNNLH